AAWRDMVEQHRESVEELAAAADAGIAVTGRDDPGRPAVGMGLLMWAAELASAGRPGGDRSGLSGGLVGGGERGVTAGARAAGGCVRGVGGRVEVVARLLE